MATILGARGWDMGNTMLNSADFDLGGTFGTISASLTTAKTGAYSLVIGSTNTAAIPWARWAISGTPANPAFSAWIYMNTMYNTSTFQLEFLLGTGEYVGLRWNAATHTFDAYVNNVLFFSGTVEVSANDWFHVQCAITIADAGNITVLIDGQESINHNGDTQPGAATGATYLRLYTPFVGSQLAYVDDLVWGSGGLLGDLRVHEKRPAADSVLVEWTPSVGIDNYALEDETPNNDADYNKAETDGLQDEFELSALDITGYTCEAVIAWNRAKMEVGTGDSIDTGIDSNGTDSVKRSALSTQWEYYWGNVESVDPDDSAVWSQAKLDALLSRKVAVIT